MVVRCSLSVLWVASLPAVVCRRRCILEIADPAQATLNQHTPRGSGCWPGGLSGAGVDHRVNDSVTSLTDLPFPSYASPANTIAIVASAPTLSIQSPGSSGAGLPPEPGG